MEVKLIEYFNEHWYKIITFDEGTGREEIVYYPSVTTVLGIIQKYGLDRWRGDIGNREADLRMNEAGNRGKRIHHAWELYNQGKSIGFWRWQAEDEPECDFALKDQGEYLDFLKLVEFRKIVDPQIIFTEKTVFSHESEIAGTCDNVFHIKEGKYLINGKTPVHLEEGMYIADLKTGNIYEEAYNQIAAYTVCFEEMKLGEIKGGLILHTKASTRGGIAGFGVKVRTRAEMVDDFQTFIFANALWSKKNTSKPRVFEFPQVVKWEEK